MISTYIKRVYKCPICSLFVKLTIFHAFRFITPDICVDVFNYMGVVCCAAQLLFTWATWNCLSDAQVRNFWNAVYACQPAVQSTRRGFIAFEKQWVMGASFSSSALFGLSFPCYIALHTTKCLFSILSHSLKVSITMGRHLAWHELSFPDFESWEVLQSSTRHQVWINAELSDSSEQKYTHRIRLALNKVWVRLLGKSVNINFLAFTIQWFKHRCYVRKAGKAIPSQSHVNVYSSRTGMTVSLFAAYEITVAGFWVLSLAEQITDGYISWASIFGARGYQGVWNEVNSWW